MKKTKLILLTQAFGCFILINSGCSKENPSTSPRFPPPTVINTPPVVYAGNTVGVFLPVDSAILFGSVTDAENNTHSYSWRQLSGPSQAVIQTPESLNTKISNLINGEYRFELTAVDKGNLRGMATNTVLVIDSLKAGLNFMVFKNLFAGCWGGECLVSIDALSLPQNIPLKFLLKSSDSSVWIELYPYLYQNRWFIQLGGGDLEEGKNWEVMVIY